MSDEDNGKTLKFQTDLFLHGEKPLSSVIIVWNSTCCGLVQDSNCFQKNYGVHSTVRKYSGFVGMMFKDIDSVHAIVF